MKFVSSDIINSVNSDLEFENSELKKVKQKLRKDMTRCRRDHAQTPVGQAAGGIVADRLLAALPSLQLATKRKSVVSGFWPLESEIDIRPALIALYKQGWQCGLPVTLGAGKSLLFRNWVPDDSLSVGLFGVAEPLAHAAECEPDLLLVPLLAFDRHGFRLGYGGGFYDRTLQALRAHRRLWAMGVGFAMQEISVVPRHQGDQPLDGMLTEQETLFFRETIAQD